MAVQNVRVTYAAAKVIYVLGEQYQNETHLCWVYSGNRLSSYPGSTVINQRRTRENLVPINSSKIQTIITKSRGYKVVLKSNGHNRDSS